MEGTKLLLITVQNMKKVINKAKLDKQKEISIEMGKVKEIELTHVEDHQREIDVRNETISERD